MELFEPNAIPYAEDNRVQRKDREWVQPITVTPGGSTPRLPWEDGHPLQRARRPSGRFGTPEWRHVVYGGVFELTDMLEILAERFGGAQDEFDPRRAKESALFAFTLDEQGVLLEDTVTFSSAAWAAGRTLSPGPYDPRWLDGFEDAVSTSNQAIAKLTGTAIPYDDPERKSWRPLLAEILGSAAEAAVSTFLGGKLGEVVGATAKAVIRPLVDPPDDSEDDTDGEENDERAIDRPVNLADIVAFHAHVTEACGIPSSPDRVRLRVQSVLVNRLKDGSLPEATPAFLNSFLTDDLKRVADAGTRSGALTAYLTEPESIPADRRMDVRADPQTVFDGLAPAKFPLARWPAQTTHTLAASQQFAVNMAFGELTDEGLFSVNGPPGTGKTTMLRDIIAAIIVERARRLASLRDPHQAFTRLLPWTTVDDQPRKAWELDPQLTGFEIVVASSNNGAVENITTELPALEAIGEEWRGEAAYFADVATSLLDGEPAWGTIAAPLGKMERRREFVQRFWWADEGMRNALNAFRDGTRLHDGGRPIETGWQDAVREFTSALAEAERLQRERQSAYEALKALENPPHDGHRAAELTAHRDEAVAHFRAAVREVDSRSHDLAAAETHLAAHEATRGHRLTRIFLREADRIWAARERELLAVQAGAAQRLARAQDWQAHWAAEAQRLSTAAQAEYRRHQADMRTRARSKDILAGARSAWPENLPEGWLTWSRDRREKSSPWSDEEWTIARTRVFLAALNLHRSFIATAGTRMFSSLNTFQELLKRGTIGVPPHVVHAAWQTLFFAVPVISTTFASCGRLFSSLCEEDLGWLLIDEAGQATPQAAVGSLWRTKRAVVVGDPLQLEPVISLPPRIQDLLRGAFDVNPAWLPGEVSAQGVADRSNTYGTTVYREDSAGDRIPIWVGAPLLVHRRCEAPMFEMSNTMAYQGMMVSATPIKPFPDDDRPCLSSSWIDVRSSEAYGKWVPEEGQALARVLRHLHVDRGVPLEDIRVLSPFRDVVSGCRNVVNNLGWRETNKLIIDTVHKMQGREADAVILVLGTHPARSQQARIWAAIDSPNLLNVAASRARRRFYAIGNLATWRNQGHCAVLANHLPRRPWPPPN